MVRVAYNWRDGVALDVPPVGVRAWQAFRELSASRSGNGFGPNPISHEALGWWQHDNGRLPDWERRAVLTMDVQGYMRRCAEIAKAANAKPGDVESQEVSTLPLTATIFDRMFA